MQYVIISAFILHTSSSYVYNVFIIQFILVHGFDAFDWFTSFLQINE